MMRNPSHLKTLSFHVNPRQRLFFLSKARFTAYGGARGGGKSWSARKKAELLALRYPGIRILMLRRTFPELRENIIRPMRADLFGVAVYKETDKTFSFPNRSLIVFGYCDGDHDVDQYQGQEYDVIFIDEATQFTEYQFTTLAACNRGVNDFPKRMYLTCNPGGVGHAWVKRLFIDRAFRTGEVPEEYAFISAKVTDNPDLMAKDPGYVKRLDALPPGIREAWRDGSWDVFAGQYFTEWNRDVHVCTPFSPPEWWRWYVTLDYGLDMLAAYLIAVDDHGNAWVTREVYEGRDLGIDRQGKSHTGLTVHDAAEAVKALGAGHTISAWFAPPDLWSSQRETLKSTAQLFAEHGVYLTRSSNDRVAGWLAVKEWLRVFSDERGNPCARVRIFPGCVNLIRTLPQLRYDEAKPSDAAGEPHELTHAPDALRYFCIGWTLPGERTPKADCPDVYGAFLTGRTVSENYLMFGG